MHGSVAVSGAGDAGRRCSDDALARPACPGAVARAGPARLASLSFRATTMWQSLPEFGTGVLYAILVTAAYTFAVALASARGRPRLLQAARLGAYGTIALVGLAVLVLAYAFVSHDFRIALRRAATATDR